MYFKSGKYKLRNGATCTYTVRLNVKGNRTSLERQNGQTLRCYFLPYFILGVLRLAFVSPPVQVAEAPADLMDRRVEITGPVDRKMVRCGD